MARIYLVEISAMLDQQVLRGGAPVAVNGAWYYGARPVLYNAAEAYTVTGSARRDAVANGALYMGLVCINAAGVPIGFHWVAAGGVLPSTDWGTYSGSMGAGSAPGGTAFIAPALVLNHGAGSVGIHECQSLRLSLYATPGVALNDDEFFRSPAAWARYAGDGVFVGLPDGTPYATTLRYGTAGYMSRPTDTPASTYYDGRVLQPALLRQEMPAEYAGAASVGYGELVLANGDGALSHLAYAGLDGQLVRVRAGDSDGPLSGFVEVFRAVANQANFDDKRVRVQLKDGLTVLDRPLLTATFAGNNALPNGLEGGDDIKGLVKPKLFGIVKNLPPPCVNTSRLIYLISDGGFKNASGALGEVDAVYDRGVALTAGAPYASQADMEANAPAAGQYRVWHDGAMFRLGSTPVGMVTCDARADTGGAGYNSWQDTMRTVAKQAGLTNAQIDIESSWSSDSKPDNWPGMNPHDVGVWVNDSRTTIDVLRTLAEGCGVMFGWIAAGGTGTPKLYAEHWPRPYAVRTEVAYGAVWYPGNAILTVRPVAASEEGAGVPAWSVQLGYAPILQLQEFDVDGSVPQSRRSFLSNERRQITASAPGVKAKHLNAVQLQRASQIQSAAAASDEAQRLLQLRRYRRVWFDVTVRLDGACDPSSPSAAPVLDSALRPRLGGYVRLSDERLRITPQSGVETTDAFFNVMALEIDQAKGTARMTVRQATEPTL